MRLSTKKILAGLFLLQGVAGWNAEAGSNFSPEHPFSWAGNAGWLNWRGDVGQGVEIDQFVCSGYIYAANVGWINLGSGTPRNGMHYQNDSAADFGVNVSDTGHLSGFAYGANIGWISFASIGDPRIDFQTGRLSGFVYGANVGWISLGGADYTLQIEALDQGKDSDGDGIPDAWEISHAGNLTDLRARGDFDHDGHSDLEEYLADTDPADPQDSLQILNFSLDPARSSVALTWTTRSTRQYVVETRGGLGGVGQWREAGVGTLSATGPSLTQQISQNPEEPQQYFRIRAVRPLSP